MQDSTSPQPAWQFHAEEPAPHTGQTPQPALPSRAADVSWSASEFIVHEKTLLWYLVLIVAAVAGAGIIYLLTRDYISVGVVAIVAVFMGLLAARKPRTLNYRLDNKGLHIGERLYPYSGFKSFSVMNEGVLKSIDLLPLQRFMPMISMYYAPEDEERILGALGSYLPYEERERDIIDRAMRKIRL